MVEVLSCGWLVGWLVSTYSLYLYLGMDKVDKEEGKVCPPLVRILCVCRGSGALVITHFCFSYQARRSQRDYASKLEKHYSLWQILKICKP